MRALAVPSYGAMALKRYGTNAFDGVNENLQSPPTGRWP